MKERGKEWYEKHFLTFHGIIQSYEKRTNEIRYVTLWLKFEEWLNGGKYSENILFQEGYFSSHIRYLYEKCKN